MNHLSRKIQTYFIVALTLCAIFPAMIFLTQDATSSTGDPPVKIDNSYSSVEITNTITPASVDESPDDNGFFSPDAVTPSTIIRGNYFISSGRLTDPANGLGLPDRPMSVYWDEFNWADYDNDLLDGYVVGQGITDSQGYYSISCRDTSMNLAIGNVSVYNVYVGHQYDFPPFSNRNFTVTQVECYATTYLGLQLDSTTARRGENFTAQSALIWDNLTLVTQSIGHNVVYNWNGTDQVVPIVGGIASYTFVIGLGASLTTHKFNASFYAAGLGLSYVVGDIYSQTQIGQPEADWANNTIDIEVYSGAGITFTIDSPLPPGIGENPQVQREITVINITGLITDDGGLPFGSPENLTLYVNDVVSISGTDQDHIIADASGVFTTSFTISGSYLNVGDNLIWLDADNASITATTEIKTITIEGNSTIVNTLVNGSATSSINALPGEILDITGVVRDPYNNFLIENMSIEAQWEDFGLIELQNTSASGTFQFSLQVPLTVNSSVENGTIYLRTSSSLYNSPTDFNFTIAVYTSVQYSLILNTTNIIEDSNVYLLDGNEIRFNSTFTLSGVLEDQFGRNLTSTTLRLVLGTFINQTLIVTNGAFSYVVTDADGITIGTHPVTLIFKDGSDFSFNLEFRDYPIVTTPPTPTPTPTPPGGNDLTEKIVIGIAISLVAIIMIVAVVYTFGRFRKSRKRSVTVDGQEFFDIPTIISQIDEAEKAKDFKRAVVLSYRAFELICVNYFGIANAWSYSPRELARLVAATNRIPVRDVTMLVMRYEEARFSDHKINAASFKQTRQALHNMQLALDKEPAIEPTR
ncbi:MAG: DUF4129 domain-containing protein [Candidatus Heimdallarchaeota archaeon]